MICQHCENEQEATIYCHSRREWYCIECARLEFRKCCTIGCDALDIEGDFNLTRNGEIICPECDHDYDSWEDTKDFLSQCLIRGIV